MSKVNIIEQIEEPNICLFTGGLKRDIQQLGEDARNCAVLDCACSSTVCGEKWLQCYIQSLNDEGKSKIIHHPGKKIFRFGGGEQLKSIGAYDLPAQLADHSITIHTDIVTSDIPLLLSLKAMKAAKIKLDLVTDSAGILGKTVALNHTSSGHYCVPIDKN